MIRHRSAKWVRAHVSALGGVGEWVGNCCESFARWQNLYKRQAEAAQAAAQANAGYEKASSQRESGFWFEPILEEAQRTGIRYPSEFDAFFRVFAPEAGGLLIAAKILIDAFRQREKPGFDPADWAKKVCVVDWLCWEPTSDPALIGAPSSMFAGPSDAPRYVPENFDSMILRHRGRASTRENAGRALLYRRVFEQGWEQWESCVRMATGLADHHAGADATSNGLDGRVVPGNGARATEPSIRWQEVRDRLLRLREQGEPYTSHGDLAKRLGCGRTTISKAIHNSNKLKGWMARERGTPAPRAHSLNEFVMENTVDERAVDPSESNFDDVHAIALTQLLDQASPEERARINALSGDEQRQLVELCKESQADLRTEEGRNRLLGRKA